MNAYLYDTLTDEKLVSLVRNGEVNAYETLVLRHQNKVLAQALAVTRNKCLAEDASQDAFITAWLKLDMLTEPGKFGAWVKQIARRRAIDLLSRMRQYVGIDEFAEFADHNADVPERIIREEQYAELHRGIARLPEKIGDVIRLFYFEGLSVAEISARMKTPAGTIKWRLSEGRRKLRGDLSAMTENENDTLLEKVMKKVAELRLWRLRREFYGFDEAYADVMADVEAMPESKEKYAAKAEVLLLGWENRPDYKHTVKIGDIREAALAGKCEAAMKFIVDKEDAGHKGDDLIEFVSKTQIPFLHENGFTETQAHEQYKLACAYLKAGDRENAERARDSVLALAKQGSPEYAAVKALFEGHAMHKDAGEGGHAFSGSMELRLIGGDLVYWGLGSCERYSDESQYSECIYNQPFCAGTDCDSRIYADGASVGDVFTATDGTTLTFVSDNETVTTIAGTFEGCEKWVTDTFNSQKRTVSYLKRGVGVVKTDVSDLYAYAFELAEYAISGGDGLIPLAAGNRWKYVKTGYYDFERCDTFEVTSADVSGAVLAFVSQGHRKSADRISWDGVLYQISNKYHDHHGHLIDVSDKLDLLDSLASTDYERTVSKMARSAMERIRRGDSKESGEVGEWNFFQINTIRERGGMVLSDGEYRWQHSFEWKCSINEKCLHNMIYDILHETAGCLFSDEWLDGKPHVYRRFKPWKRTESTIVCTKIGAVTTAAGTFHDCVDVHIVETELSHIGGLSYRSGEMTYTFARGVGILRVVHDSGHDTSIYELTSYEGIGKGYMPVVSGMRRRYDCVNMDRGYVASSDYAVVTSPTGQLALVADLCGQRRLPEKETADVRGLVELMKRGYICRAKDTGEERLVDVSDIVSLTPSRVKNDYEKALAEYASRVMKRILDTNGTMNPSRTEAGKWNFFVHYCMRERDGRLAIAMDDRRLSFEWKEGPTWQMLYTFMFDILNSNVGCIWDDSWEIGRVYTNGQTKFSLSRAEEITTAAGTFADCMRLDIDAVNQNTRYFNGRRAYYFANGIGIVRVVNHRGENEADVVYELSSYTGAIKGYMSAVPGTERRYELVDPEPGVIASVDIACELDPENGQPVFFVDQYGCMKL